ncbi:MAG: hypothetical protein V2J24_23660 [Pseudomonadales bacterium]|jgi:hypothetical protein|nr:hypothetical protein [Pseudomonadales bacterium]
MSMQERRKQAGLLDAVSEKVGQNRETFARARQLYEEVQPWKDQPDPATARKWKKQGAELLKIFDENPGLERRFALSPTFRQWMQVKGGYNPPPAAQLAQVLGGASGARSPGLGLLSSGDMPAPRASGRRPARGLMGR